MKKLLVLLFILFGFTVLCASQIEDEIRSKLPENATLIGLESNEINGLIYHHVTYLIDDVDYSLIFDENIDVIDEKAIPVKPYSVLSDEILEILNDKNIPDNQLIKINVGLITPELPQPYQKYIIETNDFSDAFAMLTDDNGSRLISWYEYEQFEEMEIAKIRAFNQERVALQAEIIEEFALRNGFVGKDFITYVLENETSIITMEVAKEEVLPLLGNNQDLIIAIELFEDDLPEITNALIATSVDPQVLNFPARQGDNIGIYFTEPTCPNTNHITRYHRFSPASTGDLSHSEITTGIAREASPLSYIYCKATEIAALPTQNELLGSLWAMPNGQFPIFVRKPIHIVNASRHTSIGQNYTSYDKEWDQYSYNNNIAIFNAAGNTGNDAGYVVSPGKGLNVIAVGNYCRAGQTKCNSPANDTIFSSSSWRNPSTKNSKPEISAPGTSIIFRDLPASTGTSLSSPLAAGIAADFMGLQVFQNFKYNPALLKAHMLVSSGDVISGGFDKVGVGGIDVFDGIRGTFGAGISFTSSSYSDDIWNEWAHNDDNPNNDYLDWQFTITTLTSNKVKVALVWMNQGDYTFAHRNEPYPIGLDLDMYIYNPNGTMMIFPKSRYDGFEFFSFTPTITGTYTVQIRKHDIRDTSTKLNIAVRVDKGY